MEQREILLYVANFVLIVKWESKSNLTCQERSLIIELIIKSPNLGTNSTFLKLLYVPLPTLVPVALKEKPWREVILPYYGGNKP